jgi:hypothetical protein
MCPSAASARFFGGFHGFHHGFGVDYVGGGYDDGGCYVTRRMFTPYGYRLRTFNIYG